MPERQSENDNVEEEMDYDNDVESPEVENVEMIESEHNSDEDMFAEDDVENKNIKRNESNLELAAVLAKTDVELFEERFEVSAHVERSKKYIERKEISLTNM